MFQRKGSPAYFVAWSIAGAMMAYIPCLIASVVHPIHISRFWFVPVFLVFVLGFAVSFLAQRRLKLNLEAEVWSATELGRVRTLLLNPFCMWIVWILLAIVGLILVPALFLSLAQTKAMDLACTLVWLLMTFINVRRLFVSPAKRDGNFAGLRNAEPLQSEHWGKLAPSSEKPLHL